MKVKMRRKTRWVVLLLVVAAGGVGLWRGLQRLHEPERGIPTAAVRRGRLDMKVYTDGELHARRSVMVVAPSVSGNLRIVRLAPTGTQVHNGDVVVEFDPSEQQYNLEENRFDLEEAEQEIAKAKADAAVQGAKDEVELLKAKFDVRRAELDMSKNELVSAIDAKKNLLALEEAKRHLTQLQQDIQSHSVSNQAALDVAQEKERKARLLMAQAESNIQSMSVKSTIDGLVSLKENERASGGFYFSGMKLPEYREGDQVGPGTLVAEVMNLEQMVVQCKVDEGDRANMNAGAAVEAHVDALPGRIFPAKVESVAGVASRGMPWSGNTTSKFDVAITMDKAGSEIRPGLTVQTVVEGGQTKDLLLVPPQALFEKDGKPFVYLQQGGNFVARQVKVTRRTESQVAIEGVSEGAQVALINPEEQPSKAATSASNQPALVGGGGR
jgi:multidrug resistance efflux pump